MSTLQEELQWWDDLARHYHQDVITPFDPKVDFRLRRDLNGQFRAWRRDGTLDRRVVLDLGCGIGEAIEMVAGTVGVAAGIDFSDGMLDASQRRLEAAGLQVRRLGGSQSLRQLRRLVDRREASADTPPLAVLARGNLLRLRSLEESCDMALAINSTAAESLTQAYRMVQQICACIKPGGVLIAVFPALDNVDYLRRLHQRHKADMRNLGHVSDDGRMYIHGDGEPQKFYTPEEIGELCDCHGLQIQRLDKIRYPWKVVARYGWGYFPRSPRLWDWYLVAKRAAS
jgi:SAM-dependent methyltransferase